MPTLRSRRPGRRRHAKAKIAERLQEILPRLAGCDHADPGAAPLGDDAVEAVGAGIGERRREFVLIEPLLLHERHVDWPRADAAGRVARPLGRDDRRGAGADIDRAAALRDVSHHLHADPAARKPRHGEPMQAEVDQFLGI